MINNIPVLKKAKNIFRTLSVVSLLLIASCSQDEILVEDQSNAKDISVSQKSDKSVELTVKNIEASAEQSGNEAENAIDASATSRWSGQGSAVELILDLGSNNKVDYLKIAYYNGDERFAYFDYEYSNDKNSWRTKKSKTSTGQTTALEIFDLANDDAARYIRLTCKGTSSGNWNSILDLEVYGTPGEEEEEEEYIPGNLDPNKAPSENFNLLQWYLSVPIDRGDGRATSIDVDALNEGYELENYGGKDYFYTASNDGGMVFRNYPKDNIKTSTNTSYTRTELREMLYGDNKDTDEAENNWYFSSSNSIPSNAGGVDGILNATLKVDRVTETSGSTSQVGRIVIGQIHASKNEPNRLYYHKQPGHDKGAIYVAHETAGGSETFINIIGSYVHETGSKAGDYTDAGEPSDGIALGEEFSYEIKVVGNDQWVTISRSGKSDITEYIDMSDSDYENDWMYFKAGVYSQNKSATSSTDYDQVTFYDLKITH